MDVRTSLAPNARIDFVIQLSMAEGLGHKVVRDDRISKFYFPKTFPKTPTAPYDYSLRQMYMHCFLKPSSQIFESYDMQPQLRFSG